MSAFNELKEAVNIVEYIESLGITDLKKKGDELKGSCPLCGESESGTRFHLNPNTGAWYCWNEKKGGGLIELVMQKFNIDTGEAFTKLAKQYAPHLLTKQGGAYNPTTSRQAFESIAFEKLYEYGRELLFNGNDEAPLEYLINGRGYTIDQIRKTEWFYYPPVNEIKAYLAKHLPKAKDQISKLNLIGAGGDTFRLAVPFRNASGRITGIAKRAHKPEGFPVGKNGKLKRWDGTPRTEKKDLFYLNKCRGKKSIVVVEGYPDAMSSHSLGMDNVVALATGNFSDDYITSLLESGVNTVILALDNDPEKLDKKTGEMKRQGIENTRRAVIKFQAHDRIRVFVVDPFLLGEYKDPDELVKAQGIEVFKDLTKKAVSGAKWILSYLLSGIDTSNEPGLNLAIYKAIEYAEGYNNPLDSADFISALSEKLEIPGEQLESLLDSHAKAKRKKTIEKDLKRLNSQIKKHLQDGEPEEAQTLLLNSAVKLKTLEPVKIPEPYTVETLISEIQQTSSGLATGYKELDKSISIKPGDGNIIIAGRTSHGKTTFMMNTLLNMVEANKDKTFVLFSYEEPARKIVTKLIQIMSGVKLAKEYKSNNFQLLTEHLKSGEKSMQEIEAAKAKYNKYAQGLRLFVVYTSARSPQLCELMHEFSRRYDIGAFFVDYIQKIGAENTNQSRQIQIQGISQQLNDVGNITDIPIILGAQFGRGIGNKTDSKNVVNLSNLRECGDIEQDANLVLGLYNEAMQKKQDDSDESSLPDEIGLDIHILKNREGETGKKVTLNFNRPILKISEIESTF